MYVLCKVREYMSLANCKLYYIESPSLAWFEDICLLIEQNPAKATASIMEFREQDYALEVCHSWIRAPTCSAVAQFQLALIMQYCSLKNWSHLSPVWTNGGSVEQMLRS